MERGFLSQKGSGGGRGVKEKNKDVVAKCGVSPSVIDETVVKEKQIPLVDTNIPTVVKSSYANVTGKPSGKKLNIHTLFTPSGNGIDVVVPVESIRAVSDRFANTVYGFFLGKRVAYPLVANYVRNTLENIVMAMPKITREGHYTCNVNVEYEWKPPRFSSCKVFGHIHEECPKNTGDGEKKTVKKPCQASRGVLVGPKMAFKSQKEYQPVTKKPNTSSIGNKKKDVVLTIEVSNSNPFDVLNSIDNDVEFGTNGGTSNLGNNEVTPSRSSFMNIDNDGEFSSNTPTGEKINKIERQIGEGKLMLLDNDGNPLVPTGIVESDSEVEVVFNETTNLRIPTSGNDQSDKGYGTNSLLEQCRDSYPDNDDYDPYNDDMYKNHDFFEDLQSICDDLDITVRGRKKE
nr:hypothetical protein [Tanacetum cinerariifolium]